MKREAGRCTRMQRATIGLEAMGYVTTLANGTRAKPQRKSRISDGLCAVRFQPSPSRTNLLDDSMTSSQNQNLPHRVGPVCFRDRRPTARHVVRDLRTPLLLRRTPRAGSRSC
jgi:hypothetical protein